MGTRNLTMVVSEKKTKVAQYGQWDGYPSGQGFTVLKFLRQVDLPKFRKDLENVRFLSSTEIAAINEDGEWKTKYPHLSRDVAADILFMIDGRPLALINQEDFAGDGLMNEWTYVIDLDKEVFEIYEGFGKKKVPKTERFAKYNDMDRGSDIANEYYPVKLKKTYKLNDLPTDEEFLKDLGQEEE